MDFKGEQALEIKNYGAIVNRCSKICIFACYLQVFCLVLAEIFLWISFFPMTVLSKSPKIKNDDLYSNKR